MLMTMFQLMNPFRTRAWGLTTLAAAALSISLSVFASRLVVYPEAQGAPVSNLYHVLVRDEGGKAWQRVPVYQWKVDHVTDGRHHNEDSNVASFDFEGSVDVAVVRAGGSGQCWRVRPLSYAITQRQQGDTLFFHLDRPRSLSVEVGDDLYHNLQLFANPLSPKVKKGKNVVWIGPGYHELDDSLAVRSGQTVYIDGGTYVKGWLSVYKAHDVRIIGTGIVNPERQHEGIMVRYSRNVVVDGPLTTQIPVGGSDSVVVRNAKVISWYGWGDGMNVFASNHISYDHVFCRTSDDCSTIYCTRKGYQGSCRDIRIHDAVYWADVAHPIMIGLHGDIEKNETITDVVYDDIDILQQNERQIDYQGCIAINNGDNILVDGITFSNIRIEDISLGNLFNFRVCYNKKYCHAPGRGIRNITLRNITYQGSRAGMSLITGYDDSRTISGIHFDNLVINGQKISDDMPDKPKWYKTSDFANMFIGEHVSDVTFQGH